MAGRSLRGLLRLSVWTVVAVLCLVPLAAFVLGGTLWQTVPSDNQTLRIPGLSAPVDIGFDANGIPRIHAATGRDAALALGFVHARDRMFQMELMRRAAAGRLSELAGPATLNFDKQMRVFGLAHLVDADLAAQSSEARGVLEAYAVGVNAWIADRGRLAAMEFLALGAPEPWRPTDSLLWGRSMGLLLSSNYRTELTRQALAGKLPRAMLEQLWPPHPAPLGPQAGLTRNPGVSSTAAGLLDILPTFPAPFTHPASASNAWAVDGAHSSTGAPLLAGDPHLEFGFPGLWYLARVETPAGVLAGATAPGVPFLILGHNGKIAWTFTTTGADTQDVFLEPDDAAFTTREERIKVRGQPDAVLTVRMSRHGPVISDLSPNPEAIMAVAMANLQPGDTAASGLLALNRAGSVAEAGRASSQISSPVQNLMVADRATIGLFVTGRVPIRRAGDGWAPVSGGPQNEDIPTADGANLGVPKGDDPHGWSGFASGAMLPRSVSPASGRLINANEPVAPPDFPVFMGRDTFRDWRARRIRALLDASPKHTVSEFAAMQIDTIGPFAVAILPELLKVPGVPAILRGWNGAMDQDAPQPLIFNAWMDAFHRAVLAKAGLDRSAGAPVFDFVPFVLSPAGASWCGGDCAALLKSTLDSTISALAARFGADQSAWRWGSVHRAVFAHPLLRGVPVAGAMTTLSIAVPGDGTTLWRGGTNPALEAVHGPSYRGVYDLADLDRSLFVVTPGQSGNPISRHARDFLTRWRDGAMIFLGSDAVETTGNVRLLP